MTAQQEWAARLADTVEEIAHVRPARHVLARLASLLHPEEPVWVDAALTSEDRMQYSGKLVIYTERLLAIVTIDGMYDGNAGVGRPELHAGEVGVTVIPRSTLKTANITPETGITINHSGAWQAVAADLSWPSGTAVTLTYEGLAEPLRLPLAPMSYGPNRLPEMWPTLRDDLTR